MLKHYNSSQNDIIVIGHHGAIQLSQHGISFKKYYKLPVRDRNINVQPIVEEVQKYRTSTVYYQTYVSLMVQDVKRISLQTAVQEEGKEQEAHWKELEGQNLQESPAVESESVAPVAITESNYIFEPSTYAVVDHLERSMLSIMISQLILESKLAQYASRFRAMSAANDRAKEDYDDLKLSYNRSKRALADERLKEIVAGIKRTVSA